MKVTLAVYLLVTMMASIYNPDFISMTIITVGLFSVQHPLYITRRIYRVLCAITFLSFFYTFAWLVYFHDENADNVQDFQ